MLLLEQLKAEQLEYNSSLFFYVIIKTIWCKSAAALCHLRTKQRGRGEGGFNKVLGGLFAREESEALSVLGRLTLPYSSHRSPLTC